MTLPRIAIFLSLLIHYAWAEAPDWLMQANAIPTPAMAAKAPAVILLDESSYEITPKGGFIEINRRAIRILTNSGSNLARGHQAYNSVSDRVEYLKAWLVRDGKTIETKTKGDWMDLATNAAGAVVDEYRSFEVSLKDKAVNGDTFGYETKRSGSLLVAQLSIHFISDLPRIKESVTLLLPPGFKLETKTSGPVALVATRGNDRSWTWTNENRPYIPEESYENPDARLDATVHVTIQPPGGAVDFSALQFGTWSDVVAYYGKLSAGQCDTSAELASKARQLTAGAADARAKIEALARYVQKLRYIAINQNYQLGYGFRPRKASLVFSTGFGDCKDKANLLVAMLREVGVTAYPVGAFLGESRPVRPDFPTPAQFNHAIVAIAVDDAIQLPAVVPVEGFGRLLIFDATDPYTQLGDLSYLLQGGQVHVEAPGNNQLTLLPAFSAHSDFRFDRRLDLALAADGEIKMTGKVSAVGQTGASLRRQFETANMPKDLEALVTKQLNEKFRGATVLEKKTDDNPANGACTLSFSCALPKSVQWLPDGTGVVKLDLLDRKYLPKFSESERRLPARLHPLAVNDEIILGIPAGYTVTEFPANSSFASPYGSFEITCEKRDTALVFTRRVELKETDVPAADYSALRKFLGELAKADRAAVLLKRQS